MHEPTRTGPRARAPRIAALGPSGAWPRRRVASRDEPRVERGPAGEFEEREGGERFATAQDRSDDQAHDQRRSGAQKPKSRPSVAQFKLAPPGDDR